MSNGRLERLFSHIKIIKSDRRSCLNEDRLDNLLRISVEGPPLSQWDSSGAVDLWWNDKTRRVPNKDSSNYEGSSGWQSTDEDLHVGFEDWETWLNADYVTPRRVNNSDWLLYFLCVNYKFIKIKSITQTSCYMFCVCNYKIEHCRVCYHANS